MHTSIKNFFGAVLCLCIAGLSTLGASERGISDYYSRSEDKAAVKSYYDDGYNKTPQKKKKIEGYSLYKAANRYYLKGRILEAEKDITEFLAINPDNEEGIRLRNKILIYKNRARNIKRNLAMTFYSKARVFYSDGNIMQSMLYARKAYLLTPTFKRAQRLYEDIRKSRFYISEGMSSSDKKKAEKALNLFVNGHFQASASLLRDLTKSYRQFDDILGVAEFHTIGRKK